MSDIDKLIEPLLPEQGELSVQLGDEEISNAGLCALVMTFEDIEQMVNWARDHAPRCNIRARDALDEKFSKDRMFHPTIDGDVPVIKMFRKEEA